MGCRELPHGTLVTLWPEVMEDLKPPECEAHEGRSGGPLSHSCASGFKTAGLEHIRCSINICLGKKDGEEEGRKGSQE